MPIDCWKLVCSIISKPAGAAHTAGSKQSPSCSQVLVWQPGTWCAWQLLYSSCQALHAAGQQGHGEANSSQSCSNAQVYTERQRQCRLGRPNCEHATPHPLCYRVGSNAGRCSWAVAASGGPVDGIQARSDKEAPGTEAGLHSHICADWAKPHVSLYS